MSAEACSQSPHRARALRARQGRGRGSREPTTAACLAPASNAVAAPSRSPSEYRAMPAIRRTQRAPGGVAGPPHRALRRAPAARPRSPAPRGGSRYRPRPRAVVLVRPTAAAAAPIQCAARWPWPRSSAQPAAVTASLGCSATSPLMKRASHRSTVLARPSATAGARFVHTTSAASARSPALTRVIDRALDVAGVAMPDAARRWSRARARRGQRGARRATTRRAGRWWR